MNQPVPAEQPVSAAAIDDPTSLEGGTGQPLRPRCMGGLRE